MKKLLWAVIFMPLVSFSQWHLTAWGGAAGYQGDLQSKRLTLDQSHFAFGLGLKYDLTSHWSLRTEVSHGSVEASDSRNEAKLRPRNLSFQSRILEGSLLAEYSLFDLSTRSITPYLFAGVAVYHFNPYAYDSSGNRQYLRPLSTEGQGLSQYPGVKPYKLTQLAIPFGGGIRIRMTDNISIGYELGMRKLFTDYLDDVSGRYVDQATLLQERGPKAVEMAFRGGELKNSTATYPAAGTLRGGSKFKDWYYFQGITLTIALPSSSGGERGRGNVDCPRRVW